MNMQLKDSVICVESTDIQFHRNPGDQTHGIISHTQESVPALELSFT